jgi:hypothetical protein
VSPLVIALCENIAGAIWQTIPQKDKDALVRAATEAVLKALTEHPAWPLSPTDPNPQHL